MAIDITPCHMLNAACLRRAPQSASPDRCCGALHTRGCRRHATRHYARTSRYATLHAHALPRAPLLLQWRDVDMPLRRRRLIFSVTITLA